MLVPRHDLRSGSVVAAATTKAQVRIAAMRAGTILPISRQTEEVVDVVATEGSAEDQRMEAILNNPIALYVFLRLTNLEDRLRLLLEPIVAELDLKPAQAAAQMEQYVELFETPGYIERVTPAVLPEDLKDFESLEALACAAMALIPIFEDTKFDWTDEVAADLLDKVTEFDGKQNDALLDPRIDGGFAKADSL